MIRLEKSNPRVISSHEPDYSMQAASVIRNGGVVAIPTETYYGLAADPFNESALQKIYDLKQRPYNKPILVLIEKIEQLEKLVSDIPELYIPLIEKYWPGPLTLIFPALPVISPIMTGGTETIGIRLSSDRTANEICRTLGFPITATSANRSGENPAGNASQIISAFGNSLDLIIDGGATGNMQCSTVVNYIGGKLRIVRPGQIELNLR